MILISVGTLKYKFNRFLKIIDELCDEEILDGNEIIAQIGNTEYIPRKYKSFSIIGKEEFEQYLEKADLIITHAGTGCVVPPLKMGKKIIAFPRLKEYDEHVDNHQLELCEVFEESGYVKCAKNKQELVMCLNEIEKFEPQKFQSNKSEFNKMIIEYIEKME